MRLPVFAERGRCFCPLIFLLIVMRAHKIPEIEANFKKTLRDGSGFTWKTSKGELADLLPADKYVNLTGKSSHYYGEQQKKTHIALHCTVGVLSGDLAALGTDKKVSTNFVIARDGTIYQLFPLVCWAYHLGLNSSGGNASFSKRSVGIEISNMGPLKLVDDKLVDIYNKDYCAASDTELYIPYNYRGFTHFATYTDAQVESTKELMQALSKKLGIKLAMPENPLAFSKDPPKTTVFCHQNTRSDKCDPGPALDYKKLL